MDLKELAGEALEYFKTFTRGENKPGDPAPIFYSLKNVRPVWLRELIYHIHDDGKFFPDDFKYSTIVEVLDAIAEGQDPDEISLEPDVYNHELIEWLASHGERAGYVDEAAKEYGHTEEGVISDIARGQWYEKDEIKGMVVNGLEKQIEALDVGEPEEMEDASEPSRPQGPKEWSPLWTKKRKKGGSA